MCAYRRSTGKLVDLFLYILYNICEEREEVNVHENHSYDQPGKRIREETQSVSAQVQQIRPGSAYLYDERALHPGRAG